MLLEFVAFSRSVDKGFVLGLVHLTVDDFFKVSVEETSLLAYVEVS